MKSKNTVAGLLLLITSVIVCCSLIQRESVPLGNSGYQNVPFGFHTGNAFPEDMMVHNPNDITDPEIWGNYAYARDIGINWERPGMYASIPLPKSGFLWPQLTDRIYLTVPRSINILANIDVRSFTVTRSPKMPEELWNLTVYHPGVTNLELINEKLYIQFVKDLIERYDGDGYKDAPDLKNPIKYWQIDNELPGIPPLGVTSEASEPENEKWFKASVNNYAHILQITSKAIKSSDPTAKVIMAGMPDIGPGTEKIFREYYLKVLEKLNDRYIDIFDYHFYGDAKDSWKIMKYAYRMIREGLDGIGCENTKIWITETGTYSGRPHDVQGYAPLQSEKEQAIDLFRRLIYPITFGVKKVFWAWGVVDCGVSKGPDGYMGLIYSGERAGEPGYGVKKLSYYTYKILCEKLKGSDWDNIQTIRESDGVYIYKFTKQGKPLWIAWNDSLKTKTAILDVGNINAVKITEAIPDEETGADLDEKDYPDFFRTETKPVNNDLLKIILGENPVFIEGVVN